MEIATERLRIRNFREEDNDALFEYLSNPAIYVFEPGKPITADIAIELSSERSKYNDFLAVELVSENRMIVHLYFRQIDPTKYATWELGYIVHPLYQKRGYATESAKAITRYGFQELGVHRIISHCSPDNTSSWKVLEKIGMRREGISRKNIFFRKTASGDPIWQDTYEYAMLSDDVS